jgi:FMN phosphatase YigB (HAD superfamily)
MMRWEANAALDPINPEQIKCVVFDFGFTLSPDYYFNVTPPGCPEWHAVIQKEIFGEAAIVNPWMKGELSSLDIARILSRYFPLDIPTIVATMDQGCQRLHFNQAVWDFAFVQKAAGRKTALVTDNMDVFSKVVVPCHGLEALFDVILNSADFHEIRKELLWPIAFERLGGGIRYANSLLIEDGETEPAMFRALGGLAHQYTDDKAFIAWLDSIHWSRQP